MRVNVFLAGAAKSGTSALAKMLAQHPEIYVSPYKEPFFFELEYDMGYEYYHNRYFPSVGSKHRVVVDARHRNMYLPFVPPRIRRYNPEAKFVIVLRHPVERALSHWWMWYSRGIERLAFWDAMEADAQRIERYPDLLDEPRGPEIWARYFWYRYGKNLLLRTYVDSGFYCKQLQRIFELFPRENVLIITFEKFRENPLEVMNELFAFLNVDAIPIKIFRENVSLGKIGTRLDDLLRFFAGKGAIPQSFYSSSRRILSIFSHRPQLSPDERRRCMERYFAQEVQCLERLLSADFSIWIES